jgi:hypothetical protein
MPPRSAREYAQSFVDARLQIINDPAAPSGDRLRAMEQLESRALGKPKETVEQVAEEPEAMKALRGMSTEELKELVAQRRHLRTVESQEQG